MKKTIEAAAFALMLGVAGEQAPLPAFAAQKVLEAVNPQAMPLDMEADGVFYDEERGLLTARGHVKAFFQDTWLYADEVLVETEKKLLRAYAHEGKSVRLLHAGMEKLAGDYLESDLGARQGFLENSVGEAPAERGRISVTGKKTLFAGAKDAHEMKWIHGKYIKNDQDSTIVRWDDAAYTSCLQEKHHYELRSKKISMVPGKYIILHRPGLYIGTFRMITLPFNILVNQKKRKHPVVTVTPDYDGDKRGGIRAKATIPWKQGRLQAGGALWHHDSIKEYDFRVDQRVTDWLSLYGGNNHHYDDDLIETKSRPFWGGVLSRGGWTLDVGWAEREKRSITQRPGTKAYDTTIWRRPEFDMTSPWASLHTGSLSQFARLKGNWGKFQETGTNRWNYDGSFIERYSWGFDYYTDYPFRIGAIVMNPFVKVDYWNHGYKNQARNRMIVTTATAGITAQWHIWEIGAAYEQRRVSGRSAFGSGSWDNLTDADTFYQRLGVRLTDHLTFSVQALVDKTKSRNEITSMGYVLSYNNRCCASWQLTYNDDKTDQNDNNWITFSIALNAFPDARYRLGNKYLSNPFGAPGGIRRKRKGYVPSQMELDGTQQALLSEIQMPRFDI